MSLREVFAYGALRGDWYRSNQALPRAIRSTVEGKRLYQFYGFPRQWLPLFTWFNVPWQSSINPVEYLPFFSDLSERKLCQIIEKASSRQMLRPLLEATCSLDPVVSDCLYILDHSVTKESVLMREEFHPVPNSRRKHLLLTSWQSYGRPSVRQFERKVARVETANCNRAVLLPCSFKRPYSTSPTHKRLYSLLDKRGYNVSKLHKIVVSSLGVIPEELWGDSLVAQYDAGVPDVYRLLRLIRAYFSAHKYELVLDCLQFRPYSDLLGIVAREGLIGRLKRVQLACSRSFYVRHDKNVLLERE